jgi:hypothetical protein
MSPTRFLCATELSGARNHCSLFSHITYLSLHSSSYHPLLPIFSYCDEPLSCGIPHPLCMQVLHLWISWTRPLTVCHEEHQGEAKMKKLVLVSFGDQDGNKYTSLSPMMLALVTTQ